MAETLLNTTNSSWIYFKIYPGSFDRSVDHLIASLISNPANSAECAKWHYLRMIDDGGPHLRIRYLASDPAQSVGLERRATQCLEAAVSELPHSPETPFTPLVPLDGVLRPSGQALLRRDQYEPETMKYGEGTLLNRCESHFQTSSEIARDLIQNEFYEGRSRKWAAPVLFAEGIRAFGLPRSATQFLSDYSDYWMQHAQNAHGHLDQFDTRITELRETGYDPFDSQQLTAEETVLLERWQDELSDLSGICKTHMPGSRNFADHLAFNVCHLFLNRLGFPVLDEAYLARMVGSFCEGRT